MPPWPPYPHLGPGRIDVLPPALSYTKGLWIRTWFSTLASSEQGRLDMAGISRVIESGG